MEVGSLLAVTALVSHGFGLSVVPQHPREPSLPETVICLPFGEPQSTRQLALLERSKNRKQRLTDALLVVLKEWSLENWSSPVAGLNVAGTLLVLRRSGDAHQRVQTIRELHNLPR